MRGDLAGDERLALAEAGRALEQRPRARTRARPRCRRGRRPRSSASGRGCRTARRRARSHAAGAASRRAGRGRTSALRPRCGRRCSVASAVTSLSGSRGQTLCASSITISTGSRSARRRHSAASTLSAAIACSPGVAERAEVDDQAARAARSDEVLDRFLVAERPDLPAVDAEVPQPRAECLMPRIGCSEQPLHHARGARPSSARRPPRAAPRARRTRHGRGSGRAEAPPPARRRRSRRSGRAAARRSGPPAGRRAREAAAR